MAENRLILVGTNHKYSPLELRERISFLKRHLPQALLLLKQNTGFSGVVIISTCNRVEIYANYDKAEVGFLKIEEFLSRYHEIEKIRLSPYLYRYKDKEALRHLFSVACGLDSQILGENEILNQINFFYEQAKLYGFTDFFMDRIFASAIEIGKLARLKTKIAQGSVSIGSITVKLIRKEIGDIAQKNILLVGAGKVQELVLKYLKKENPRIVFVSNRTYKNAVKLAEEFGIEVVRFESLKRKIKEVDVIITATDSPHTIIRKEDLIDYKKPLLLIDLSIPRDIEPKIKELKGIKLFCLDDLNTLIEENLAERKKQIPYVEKIIEEAIENLWKELIELAPEKVPSL